jgi:ketosteroid isomerase-like protein
MRDVARETDADVRATVLAHFDAFNTHDTERLVAGLHEDVTWVTGIDRLEGLAAVRDLFDDWLWAMQPRIDVVRLLVDADSAAAECVEHPVIDGEPVAFPIAVFFTVREGLLLGVKVFREGSADIG